MLLQVFTRQTHKHELQGNQDDAIWEVMPYLEKKSVKRHFQKQVMNVRVCVSVSAM